MEALKNIIKWPYKVFNQKVIQIIEGKPDKGIIGTTVYRDNWAMEITKITHLGPRSFWEIHAIVKRPILSPHVLSWFSFATIIVAAFSYVIWLGYPMSLYGCFVGLLVAGHIYACIHDIY